MIYLDNAATTFPKPVSVIDEVRRCMQSYCGNAGRGAHALSLAAANKIFECREALADTFGACDTDRVFFTPNTTYGINAVIKGSLKDGDHVIISDMEHNSVWRPIRKLAEQGRITYDVFNTLTKDSERSAERICANILRLMRSNTKLVFCTHASNICSAVMPVAEIGALCRKKGVLFAVDGAQSAGHEHINIEKMNIDALCIPGHKGLYGPQGSGAVILGKGIELDSLIEGGNGIDSLEWQMSFQAPERYEAGTLATPAIAGLCEGIREVKKKGIDYIADKEKKLCLELCEMLGNVNGVTLYAPQYLGSIALFNIDGVPSERVTSYLDGDGVCARGGYHCAALAHKTLGTLDGGAVRLSTGMYTKRSDIDSLYKIIKKATKELK